MCNAQARHLNLLLPQGNSSSAFFCITKPRKALEVDLTHLQKNWNGLVELFRGDLGFFFKISRPLRNVKFTINLARGDKLIGRFHYILHGFSNKNLRLPCISITQIHF